MKKVLLIALCGLLVACGGNSVPVAEAPEAPLKVDLNLVVADGSVRPAGGMTTSGQPDEAAMRVFADSGYAAVIDLRAPDEDRGIDEKVVVEGLGMSYVPLPIVRSDITYEKAAALDELLSSYDEPVLVHCGSANRVGALLALRASANGADDEAAIQAGRRAGLTSAELEALVREEIGSKK